MEKFFRGIVKHRLSVILIFAALTVVSLILSPMVSVNNNIADYLPDDAASTVSINVMNEEFSSPVPNLRAMVADVTIPQALEYKERIAAVDGVLSVDWLDDFADITIPLEFMDQDAVESYYKDGCAAFSVVVDSQADKRDAAVYAIRDIVGEDGAMSGTAVNSTYSAANVSTELMYSIGLSVIFTFIILMLTLSSWAEPMIILISIGVAILINSGTNIFLGEISFVSKISASVLQLGVSIDYSIFLLHRFGEYRRKGLAAEEAMVQALTSSIGSIASSGLTTVVGFAALVVMRFKIGPDMGVVMAKGIVLSLISVFLLLPCLILFSYKLIDRTNHKVIVRSVEPLSRLIAKIKAPAAILFVILVIPSILAQGNNQFLYGASHLFKSTGIVMTDRAKIEGVFGQTNTMVLLVPEGDFAAEKQLSDELKDIPQMKSVISYVDNVGQEIPPEYLDDDTREQLLSGKYSRLVLNLDCDAESEQTFAVIEEIKSMTSGYYGGAYYLAGDSASTHDLKTVITADSVTVNLLAAVSIFLILLLTFRSLTIPVILVASIEGAIWLNLAIPYFTGEPLFYIGYLIISSVQLGATVDYAILLTSRYMEFRKTMGKREAIHDAVSRSGISIITSCAILAFAGVMLRLFSSNQLVAQLGMLLARGTLLSATVVLFALPGFLQAFDGLIRRTTLKTNFLDSKKETKQ